MLLKFQTRPNLYICGQWLFSVRESRFFIDGVQQFLNASFFFKLTIMVTHPILQACLLNIFKKLKAEKTQPQKKTQGHF